MEGEGENRRCHHQWDVHCTFKTPMLLMTLVLQSLVARFDWRRSRTSAECSVKVTTLALQSLVAPSN